MSRKPGLSFQSADRKKVRKKLFIFLSGNEAGCVDLGFRESPCDLKLLPPSIGHSSVQQHAESVTFRKLQNFIYWRSKAEEEEKERWNGQLSLEMAFCEKGKLPRDLGTAWTKV